MAPKKKTGTQKKEEEPKVEEAKKAAEEPPAKKAKTEEAAAPAAPAAAAAEGEETKPAEEPEAPKEKETDAPVDKRTALKEAVTFHATDTTLNVVPAMGDRVLASLTESGMQYLIAGARANVGTKAGRYMFEVRVVEALATADQAWGRGTPKPRQLLRVGFSTAGSPLVLGDSEEHVYFDSEGAFVADKERTTPSKTWGKGEVISVLLNLDPKSPNANTVSAFKDGERISQPQAIPEKLKGKPLFAHVSYRNVTVQVNFGPQALKELPFKCRMLGGAAASDVMVSKTGVPKDGKYEVMLPVAYPNEGTFEWLDGFLAKNPEYVELSDRKILDWAKSSGLWKPSKQWKSSLDKPDYNFGIPSMDDFSVRKVLNSVSTVVPRNYVVMEVRNNLLQEERKKTLTRFSGPHFKKTACVVMGEPSEEFKEAQLEQILQEKQTKADSLWKAQQAEKARKKLMEEHRKKLEADKKAAQEAAKKEEGAAGETKMEVDEEKKEEEAEAKGEAKEEESKEEPKKEEGAEGEVKEEEKKDMEVEDETEPPKVELTEEENNIWFKPKGTFDIKDAVFIAAFSNFTIPEQAEGFDAIKFEWQKEEESKEYLRSKVLEKKRTTRLDGLQPSAWFQEKAAAWKKTFGEWQIKHAGFKSSSGQAAAAEQDAEKAAEGAEGGEEASAAPKTVDIFSVEDVNDVGKGVPLFKDFAFEDWALLQLRYELFLLVHGFKKDVNDPDRPGVPEQHLIFYYNKYFRKHLNYKSFGVENSVDLVKLVKDAVALDGDVLTTPLAASPDDDAAHFVKLAEEARRERQRRLDAGDETARLKITPAALHQPAPVAVVGGGYGKGGGHWQQAPKVGGGWKGGGKWHRGGKW